MDLVRLTQQLDAIKRGIADPEITARVARIADLEQQAKTLADEYTVISARWTEAEGRVETALVTGVSPAAAEAALSKVADERRRLDDRRKLVARALETAGRELATAQRTAGSRLEAQLDPLVRDLVAEHDRLFAEQMAVDAALKVVHHISHDQRPRLDRFIGLCTGLAEPQSLLYPWRDRTQHCRSTAHQHVA